MGTAEVHEKKDGRSRLKVERDETGQRAGRATEFRGSSKRIPGEEPITGAKDAR